MGCSSYIPRFYGFLLFFGPMCVQSPFSFFFLFCLFSFSLFFSSFFFFLLLSYTYIGHPKLTIFTHLYLRENDKCYPEVIIIKDGEKIKQNKEEWLNGLYEGYDHTRQNNNGGQQ